MWHSITINTGDDLEDSFTDCRLYRVWGASVLPEPGPYTDSFCETCRLERMWISGRIG